MSEQLIPKKGDRVRLVHAEHGETTVTVARLTTSGGRTAPDYDWLETVEGEDFNLFDTSDGDARWQIVEVVK